MQPIDDTTLLQRKGSLDPLVKDIKSIQGIAGIYTPEQKKYLSFLQVRLESAKRQKDQPWPEWNNKNYYKIFDENEDIANTKLPPKTDSDEVNVSAGTVESKLDSLLSNIYSLDLAPEVHSFDRANNRIHELGVSLEDALFVTEQNDGGTDAGDEEKKMLRQRELLKQGTVFVQEEWLRRFEMKKKLTEKYNGQFKDWKNWTAKLELVFEGPARTMLYGPNVFLGDMTKFAMEDQPFIFAVINQDYEIAKTKYGKFENWEYVVRGAVPSTIIEQNRTIYNNAWRLTNIADNQVEIILYQDQPNDEFQIIINGVMMFPIGYPLSAVAPGGKYNIAKQVFRPYSANFAYGKSFVSSGSIKELSALIDEMLKLFILKTRKSVSVPYVNTSGRVISKRVLSPGRISMGIPADALKPIGTEGQGVTASEYQILKELQDRIDKSTVSPQFQGQQGARQQTATEVLELQRQAKQTLGLTIAACMLLERKLSYLRLWNVLQNYFEPIGTRVIDIDSIRQEVNQHRVITRRTNINGAGMGERQIIPTDQTPLPDAKVIRALENTESNQKGIPVQKIYLDPNGLKTAKLTWYIVITPRDKETHAGQKLMFREMLTDLVSLRSLGIIVQTDGLEEGFSEVWEKDRSKFFSKPSMSPEMAGVSGAMASGAGGRPNVPGVPSNVPSEVAA